MSRYKNISQRAKRYARGKSPRANVTPSPLHVDTVRAQSFADGYRLAMKELRQILNSDDAGFGGDHLVRTLEKLACDTERLK